MSAIRVQTADFDIGAECRALVERRTDIGAVVSFTGCVRDDGGLTSLLIEHYPGMTEREIADYISEAQERWPVAAVRVVHRVGLLHPGEQIVFAGAAAVHREPAFRAAEFLMDYLKTRAPFWKLERRGASANWVEAKAVDTDAAVTWSTEE